MTPRPPRAARPFPIPDPRTPHAPRSPTAPANSPHIPRSSRRFESWTWTRALDQLVKPDDQTERQPGQDTPRGRAEPDVQTVPQSTQHHHRADERVTGRAAGPALVAAC